MKEENKEQLAADTAAAQVTDQGRIGAHNNLLPLHALQPIFPPHPRAYGTQVQHCLRSNNLGDTPPSATLSRKMAKKTKDDVPNPNSVTNRDILQRLNFLYQASQLLGSMAPVQQCEEHPSPEQKPTGAESRARRRDRTKKRHPSTLADLSRAYTKSMKVIGQKTNVRMYASCAMFLPCASQILSFAQGPYCEANVV